MLVYTLLTLVVLYCRTWRHLWIPPATWPSTATCWTVNTSSHQWWVYFIAHCLYKKMRRSQKFTHLWHCVLEWCQQEIHRYVAPCDTNTARDAHVWVSLVDPVLKPLFFRPAFLELRQTGHPDHLSCLVDPVLKCIFFRSAFNEHRQTGHPDHLSCQRENSFLCLRVSVTLEGGCTKLTGLYCDGAELRVTFAC